MTWPTVRLGEVTKVVSGTTPASSNPSYWNGSAVWVTPTDLGKLNAMEIAGSERRLTDAGIQSCSLTLIPRGSVIMSSRAPIGHLAMGGCDLYTNQGCKSFVCGDRVHAEFLYFILRWKMDSIRALGSGATFTEVSKSALEQIEICLPSLGEQRAIAACLKEQLAEVDSLRASVKLQRHEVQSLEFAALRAELGDHSGIPVAPSAKLRRFSLARCFR